MEFPNTYLIAYTKKKHLQETQEHQKRFGLAGSPLVAIKNTRLLLPDNGANLITRIFTPVRVKYIYISRLRYRVVESGSSLGARVGVPQTTNSNQQIKERGMEKNQYKSNNQIINVGKAFQSRGSPQQSINNANN